MKRNLQEEADTFQKFLNEWGAKHLAPEYAQKQQVSKFGRCGESAGSEPKKAASGPSELVRNIPPLSNEQRPIQVSCGGVDTLGRLHGRHDAEPNANGSEVGERHQDPSPGIHLVPEPPAIPEEAEWSDGMTGIELFHNSGFSTEKK